jgi:hypothetical protein
MHRKASFLFAALFSILAIVIITGPPAQTDVVGHARIVRLSFVEGDVAFQRPGSTWERAMANLPIQQDYSIRTDSGYAEVEFETGLVIRLAQNTQLDFTELSMLDGHKITALKLDHGTIIATANLSRYDQLSVAAGNLNVTGAHNGRFRIDATDSQDYVTVFHGNVDVANGATTTGVESGKSLHFDAAGNTSTVDHNPHPDAFDKWVSQRDEAQQTSQSDAGDFINQRNYPYTVGDLYDYGLWANISGYGMGWQPYGVGPSWMPFGNGMWMFDDPSADWMWTSFEPWGWLPYHYGGWVNIAGGGWFWIPQNLGVFKGATANFVSVGNQVGWTPTLAPPMNPGKVKTPGPAPIHVVFAGGGSNGVIVPGPHGILKSPETVKTVTSPAASFVQRGEPTPATLAASGVTVTGRAPSRAMNSPLAYAPRETPGVNRGAPSNQGAPSSNARPFAMAPHSSPAPVVRAPSTFAGVNSGGRVSGIAPAGSISSSAGNHGGAPGATGASGSSNSSGSGAHSTTGSSGASSTAGSTGGAVHH